MTKLSRQANSRLSQRKQVTAPRFALLQKIFASTFRVNLVLVAVLASVGFSYLGVVNSAAGDTFRVAELNKQVDQTQQANRDLELAISEVQSLQHVKTASEDFSLVAGGTVQYVGSSSAVALSQ